ncbi:sugar phosphate isomerase/epimerase family protein [Aquibacillus kalidii]|uniref:sugar phosphate isomerase/epimerase family protein n=1 Tax=Aquibacillus kalidii TaxID=2762597 RepID=UPI0016486C0D|nr:sugar phosphate isomerase/epimerase family protein [Aquibacillus kalidii]
MSLKLAFTTLGCPNWDLNTIIKNAVKNGYQGVDFRGYLGEFDIYKLPVFTTKLEETKQLFKDACLEIPCFSSSVSLITKSEQQLKKSLDELEAYGYLCNQFGASYIRVFGGMIGDMTKQDALRIAIDNVEQMLVIAEKYNVTLLLETHDDFIDSQSIKHLLTKVESPRLQILWDVHHPYRLVGELPEETWNTLGDRIKYTHWKDSYLRDDHPRGYQLCLLGSGDIPLKESYNQLIENGYSGYFTLEWEKIWCPEIEEPEVAFEQFAKFMRTL